MRKKQKKRDRKFNMSATTVVLVCVAILFFSWQVIQVRTQTKKLGGFHYFVGSRDFRAYYTAGRLVLHGVRGNFYDFDTQLTTQQQFVPELKDPKKFMPFLNPPFVAAPVVIVSFLPFTTAYLFWLLVGIVLLLYLCRLVYRVLEGASETIRSYAVFFSLTFLPAVNAVLQGQPSLLFAIALLFGFTNFRAGKDFTAGLWLSLLLIKPQYLLLPVVLLIGHRRFKALLGLGTGLCALLGISWLLVGSSGLLGYRAFASQVPYWGEQDILTVHPQMMHTFKGLLHLLFGTNFTQDIVTFWLFGCTGALVLLLLIWARRWQAKSPQFYLQWASLIVGMIFISPHANFHDVSILLIAGLLVIKYAAFKPRLTINKVLSTAVAVGWFVMLLTLPFAKHFYIQLSVVYMFILLCLLFVALHWETKEPPPGKAIA